MPQLIPDVVVEALVHLRAVRPELFGSNHHAFKLNPVSSESRVGEFERKLSIHLPSEYREFITGVGNGGAGLFYGIFPLGYVHDNLSLRESYANDGLIGDPSQNLLLRARVELYLSYTIAGVGGNG